MLFRCCYHHIFAAHFELSQVVCNCLYVCCSLLPHPVQNLSICHLCTCFDVSLLLFRYFTSLNEQSLLILRAVIAWVLRMVCVLSIHLAYADIVSKWLIIGSCKECHTIPLRLFFDAKNLVQGDHWSWKVMESHGI